MAHPKALSIQKIKAMLAGGDLVKRAMAAFLLVKCAGSDDYPVMQTNLDSGVDLVRMDTIQALGFAAGPDGYAYLANHRPAHASADMIRYWEGVVAQKGQMPWAE